MAFMQVDFFSETLRMCMQANVIIPQNTNGQIGMEGKAEETYPTLYLLHGMSDNQTIWMRRTSIERYATERGFAVVMPTTYLGWYTDTQYGMKYFTYITEELPRLMQGFFKGMSKDPKDNYVAGLSMGGYGALKCALAHPETFSMAASLSAATDVSERVGKANLQRGLDYWEGIFGPASQVKGGKDDLFALAKSCREKANHKEIKLPEIFMWCGTEDSLLNENRSMRDCLNSLNFHVNYNESAGTHSWVYWDVQIQNVLKWIDEFRSNGGLE